MSPEAKSLHPFFSKGSKQQPSSEEQSTPNAAIPSNTHNVPGHPETSAPSIKPRKKRTRKNVSKDNISTELVTKGQTSLERFSRPPKTHNNSEGMTVNKDDATPVLLDEEPNLDRKKRRKTVLPIPAAQLDIGHLDLHHQLQVEGGQSGTGMTDNQCTNNGTNPTTPESTQGSESLLRLDDPVVAPHENIAANPLGSTISAARPATPKTQMMITQSWGLMFSPPKTLPESPSKKRGRPRAKPKIPSTVTVIRYNTGSDLQSRNALGQKIETILNGPRRPAKRTRKIKAAPAKPTGPPKPSHSFFKGKTDELATKPNMQQVPHMSKKSACTPGKLRAEMQCNRPLDTLPASGGNTRGDRENKPSGLDEPLWPTQETIHVRNLEEMKNAQPLDIGKAHVMLRPQKLKSAVIKLSSEESLITKSARGLSTILQHASTQQAHSFRPPEHVRLPKRLLISSTEVMKRVCEQILASSGNHAIPELQLDTHPAIASLFYNIKDTLTPFDEGRCEIQAWSQKYRPQSTSHVLHNSEEARALRAWLESLTVMAVGGALKTSALSDDKQPPRKKRKQAVDSFIVSDDEDDDEAMIEIPNDDVLPHLRSLRQSQWTRNKNVVVISGPHGCGKSALIHAVATELNFEVFEINAGMRRAGKDIQDKVGSMIGNHLVNHKRSAAPAREDITPVEVMDDEKLDNAVQNDIANGRQGMMTSFLQVNPAVKAKSAPINKKPASKPQAKQKRDMSIAQTTLPIISAARKSQQQSLIFFEEADILFEEDQQFWAQVTKLARNSKRPVIISCNDETQIPFQNLPLAAVLRLQPPPVDLATDYLLALAGKEGHVLERNAVEDLYSSKNHDLRASINELDFWCQMAVGDQKGGLEWMYQRWPPGKDRDQHGDLLRVTSQDTYQPGMGWLSHDAFDIQPNTAVDNEEEVLKGVWTNWGISPSEWTASTSLSPQGNTPQDSTPLSNIDMLSRLEDIADSLSASDVYSQIGLPTYLPTQHEPTDATLPPVPKKSRLNYTISAPLLQVDPRTEYLSLDTSLQIQTRLSLNRAYPELRASSTASPDIASETTYTKAILYSRRNPVNKTPLTRANFSAFDILAFAPDTIVSDRTSYNLTPSAFDRPLKIITLDLAPYVRSIVAHEQVLQARRASLPGHSSRRVRTTRVARTAREGGKRETKRKENWFSGLEFASVMETAGSEWAGMGWKGEGEDELGNLRGMLDGADSDGDEDGVSSESGGDGEDSSSEQEEEEVEVVQ